jgi:nitrite reductase (NADH) small subunit
VTEWRDVGAFEELERAGRLVARIGGRELGVVLDGGRTPYAIRNRCPHHGGPLCLGDVRARASGTPGRYELAGGSILRCPWHGWEFDLESGRCLDEPTLRAAVYEVQVVDGRVLVRA